MKRYLGIGNDIYLEIPFNLPSGISILGNLVEEGRNGELLFETNGELAEVRKWERNRAYIANCTESAEDEIYLEKKLKEFNKK